MGLLVEQILLEIDKLSLAEQIQVLRKLGYKIGTADNIRNGDLIDLERQKSRISNMFAKFNEDDDEEDQQEALEVISNLTKTSI